jgi:hypothetical protein
MAASLTAHAHTRKRVKARLEDADPLAVMGQLEQRSSELAVTRW